MEEKIKGKFYGQPVITKKDQLFLFDENLNIAFEVRNPSLNGYIYSCVPLNLGDNGKCMLVYHPESNNITFRVGKDRRVVAELPSEPEEIAYQNLRRTSYHKFMFGEEEIGLGGGVYAVFDKKKIIVGDDSGDFGKMHIDIMKECLKNSGLEILLFHKNHFIDYDIKDYMKRRIEIDKRGRGDSQVLSNP